MKHFIADFIDLKLSALLGLFIGITQLPLADIYKVLMGLMYFGYHGHRWYLMYKSNKKDKK